MVSDVTKGYVIPTSYFGNVYNITAIEVVAVAQGQLAIDVNITILDFILYSKIKSES